MTSLTRAEVEMALRIARDLAGERASKNAVWEEVYRAIEKALYDRIYYEWDGKTRPTRFFQRMLRERVDGKVAELAATTIGEALEEFQTRHVVVVRGEEVIEWYGKFAGVEGLRSCMTGKRSQLSLYAEHPEIVSLWVLVDREGKPLARAIMWEKALVKYNADFVEAKVLDRIYAVSRTASDRLRKEAWLVGAWTRSEQSFHQISMDRPLVAPNGEEATIARVYLEWSASNKHPEHTFFPYMDTFKFIRFADDGRMILSTKKPKDGPYAALENTDGGWTPYRGFDGRWCDLRVLGATSRQREEDEEAEHDFACEHCGTPIDEDEAWYYNDEPYCHDCFHLYFFVCDGCNEAYDRDQEYRVDDYVYCESCFNENYAVCERCGEAVDRDYAIFIGDEAYCEDCFGRVGTTCANCNEAIYQEDARYVDGEDVHLCEYCYERIVETCAICDRDYYRGHTYHMVDEDGTEAYICADCASETEDYAYCSGHHHYVHRSHMGPDGLCNACRVEQATNEEVEA